MSENDRVIVASLSAEGSSFMMFSSSGHIRPNTPKAIVVILNVSQSMTL